MTAPQNKIVADHLRAGKRITAGEAWATYGIARVGARVFDLKQAGMAIDKTMIEVAGRNGKAWVAEYFLVRGGV